MGYFPAILKKSDNPASIIHIGGVLSFMEPLCRTVPDDETDILGRIANRDEPVPRENVSPLCFALYEQGFAWKPPSARE